MWGVQFFVNNIIYTCESKGNPKMGKSRRHCAAAGTASRHRELTFRRRIFFLQILAHPVFKI